MRHMRIVITGGAGFIGSNLATELAGGNEVTIMDDLHTGRIENISGLLKETNVRMIKGDVADRRTLTKVFRGNDIVFHLAAITSIVESSENYQRANDVNVNGTLNVLLTARDEKLQKVVFASSSAVYGDTKVIPISEDVRPAPISTYGVAKLAGEYYCRIFHQGYGLPTVALRFFNVYGPRQNPDSPYAAVIPKFISAGLRGEPFVIYGDGTQTRDFIYVKDVVGAIILAAERCEGEVLNVGGGKEVSVNLLAEKIARMLGEGLKAKYRAPRPGDIKRSCADISKARRLLKFRPKFTLDEGLSETIKHLRNSEKGR